LLVKGLLALVYSAYEGAMREDILALDVAAALETVGLLQHLSPNRRNGLASVVQRIQTLARA
jgi:cysteine desulfuration protein SufE